MGERLGTGIKSPLETKRQCNHSAILMLEFFVDLSTGWRIFAKSLALSFGAYLLVGCSMTPPTRIQQPMTAKPVANKMDLPVDGAIFHAGVNERPLFEDKRARNVGDILVITIAEKTSGNRKNSGSSSNSNSIDANTPSVAGPLAAPLLKVFSFTGDNSNETANAGSSAATQDFSGTLTVTVIEVLDNGNLLVAGEKHVGLNHGDEFIRFSGVVNPASITGANTVSSSLVADAHIEYKNAGAMSEVVNDMKSLGFLGRFFQSVMPF